MSKSVIQREIDKRLSASSTATTTAECSVYDAAEMASLLLRKHKDIIEISTGNDFVDLVKIILNEYAREARIRNGGTP